MAKPATYDEAVRIYRSGKWACPPPLVYSGNWDEAAWVMYIWGIEKPRA